MRIQIDGSPHPWLEERGDKIVLLLAVDDATSTVTQAVFHPSEDTRSYLVVLEGLVRQWEIPLALYSNRHAAFKYNAHQGAGPLRVHPVRPGNAGTGHPANLCYVTTGQGKVVSLFEIGGSYISHGLWLVLTRHKSS